MNLHMNSNICKVYKVYLPILCSRRSRWFSPLRRFHLPPRPPRPPRRPCWPFPPYPPSPPCRLSHFQCRHYHFPSYSSWHRHFLCLPLFPFQSLCLGFCFCYLLHWWHLVLQGALHSFAWRDFLLQLKIILNNKYSK